VSDHRKQLDRLLAERNHAARLVREEKSILNRTERRITVMEESQSILQGIAKTIQQSAHKQISCVVTQCLRSVMREDVYDFRIDFVEKRGKTEAKLIFFRNGIDFCDPLNEVPGGVIDLAAFALRIACLMLSRPRLRKVLILDEPYKFLNGEDYQEQVKGMLEELSQKLGIQFIIITDDPWLKVGKVIEL
jgi:hypothetical protein